MSRKKIPSMTLTFAGFILGTILGILGNVGPDSIKTQLQQLAERFNLSYGSFWLLLIILLSLFGFATAFLKEWFESTETVNLTNIIDSERENIINTLTGSYETRLVQKLDQRITLKLELKYTKEGTSTIYAENYFAEDAKDEKEIRITLSAILNKHHSLLILGKPGAGKTTLLLDLAVTFLEQAKVDKNLPYPVILDLSSWQLEKKFAEWCQDILVNGYGFNSKLAYDVIANRKLLPFLDGLDEISDINLRDDCLEKLRQFRNDYEPEKIVITSRIDEYTETTIDAPVRAEVLVKDLTKTQVEKVLQNASKQPKNDSRKFANPIAAQNLLLLGRQNSAFKDSIRTPIYFNLATQIFDTPIQNVEMPDEKESLQNYLVETFIEKQISQSSTRFPSAEKNKQYLFWLARKLNDNGQKKTFELATFQPSYLTNLKLFNYVFGLITGVVFSLVSIWMFNWVIALFGFLLGFLLGGLIDSPKQIQTEDLRKWKLSNLLSFEALKEFLIISSIHFVIGFAPAFFGISFLILIGGFEVSLADVAVLCSFSGIVFGLAFGLVKTASKISLFSKTQKPYQRFKSGLLFQMFLFSFVMSASFYFFRKFHGDGVFEINRETFLGLFLGATIGFIYSAIFLHFVLRFCFYLEGSMPLRYVDFLKYVTSLRILEQDGGQWRFRHKILQDYFAEL